MGGLNPGLQRFEDTISAQLENSSGVLINPATEEKQNTIIANQTNGEQETKLLDEYGNDIEGTMMNQLKVAESHRLSGGVFNGSTVDTNFYTNVDVNGGTCAVANAELTCSVTTTSGSSTSLYANSLARYMGANMNYYRSVFRVGDTGAVNNTRRWGVTDDIPSTTGIFFQLSGTTFSVVTRKGSSDTVISSGNFNGNVSSYTLDTNYHTYEIYLTHRRMMLVIDGVPIHTFTSTNSSVLSTWHLRPCIINTNTGVGSAVSCYTSVMTISRYGTANSQAKTYFQQGTTAGVILKIGPGALHLLNISGVLNNSVVNLYDGTSAAGTLLWSSGAMGAQTIPFGVPLDSSGGTTFNNGLFLTITGANSNCFIKYE